MRDLPRPRQCDSSRGSIEDESDAVTRSTAARLQLLGAAMLFSTAGAAIKLCALTNWQLASFRAGVAALVLFAGLPRPAGRRLGAAFAVGASQALTMIGFVSANKLTTSANAIFLQSTAPLYVLLLAPLLLRETVRRADGLFLLALAAGLLCFFHGADPSTATAPNPALGNAVAASTGLTWALTVVGLRWISRGPGNESRTALVVANLIAFAVCLPFALPMSVPSARDLLLVGYLGAFQVGLAYVLIARGMPDVPALEATLLLWLEPVLNPIWAWLVHGEVPGPWSLAGGALILGATAARTIAGTRRVPARDSAA